MDDTIRKCFTCGYSGPMKTWLRNYNGPQFIAVLLLICYIIPGIIFIAWGWGKYKCPSCGALAKNAPTEAKNINAAKPAEEKKCPFCAEIVKAEAIKCKHCGSKI